MRGSLARYVVRTGASVLAAVLVLIAPALAADTAVRPQGDVVIREAAVDAILGYVYYGVFDSVGVSVENGVVTVQGSVNQPWRKDEIGRILARLDGVREVKNQIRVQPVSIFDDRLRVQLYRRIYGNDLFQRYATFANPPIRIIVENGNITLTGIVNSAVEKAVLTSIARGTLAFKVDNLVQVESEIQKEPSAKTSE